jgi:hypothetical protein
MTSTTVIAPGGPGSKKMVSSTKKVAAVAHSKKVESAINLLRFDESGAAVIDKAVYERVRVTKQRLAIVGIARTGKSSLVNMICSRLAEHHIRPFASDAGTIKVTVGITVVFIGDIAILDCQGICQGDSSNDKTLLLVCHYIADVFVYNQTALLDNTIFANLIQMAAFVALTENGKIRPPHLVIRVRDLTGGDFDEKSEMDKFLSLKYNDNYQTMRSAFDKLFNKKSVVASDLIGKTETKTMGGDYMAFMTANPSFDMCVRNIIALLAKTPLEKLDIFTTFDAMMHKECGLTLRDLDALSTGMELAMRRFIDEYRTSEFTKAICDGHDVCATHVSQRAAKNKEILNNFDKQFSRVNELNYNAQRTVLYDLLTRPLFTCWHDLWNYFLTNVGFRLEKVDADGYQYTIREEYILSASRTKPCGFYITTISSYLCRDSSTSLEHKTTWIRRAAVQAGYIRGVVAAVAERIVGGISSIEATLLKPLISAVTRVYDEWAAKDPTPSHYAKAAIAAFESIDDLRSTAMVRRSNRISKKKHEWVNSLGESIDSLLKLEHSEVSAQYCKDAAAIYPMDIVCSYTITFKIKQRDNELVCEPSVDSPTCIQQHCKSIPAVEFILPQDGVAIKKLLMLERRTAHDETLFYCDGSSSVGCTLILSRIREFFGDNVVGVYIGGSFGTPFDVFALEGTKTATKLINLVRAAKLATAIPINEVISITPSKLIELDRRNLIDGECRIMRLREAIVEHFKLIEFPAA